MISVFCLKLKIAKYCGLLVYEHCELTGITVCGPWYLRICLQDGSVQTLFEGPIFRTNSDAFPKK